VVKFDFSRSNLRKQPFLLKIFKIQGRPRDPPLSDAHSHHISLSRNFAKRSYYG